MQDHKLQPGLVLLLCLLCYVSTLGTALAFLLAAVVHELGHILAIRLCGGQVREARIGGWGAVLSVDMLSPGQELICALAGPLASFLLLPFGRLFPPLSLFALAQGLYNLLPIYPMDGGRALYCALRLGLKQETAWAIAKTMGIISAALLTVLGIYGAVFRHYGIAPAVFAGLFLYRTLCLWRNG